MFGIQNATDPPNGLCSLAFFWSGLTTGSVVISVGLMIASTIGCSNNIVKECYHNRKQSVSKSKESTFPGVQSPGEQDPIY